MAFYAQSTLLSFHNDDNDNDDHAKDHYVDDADHDVNNDGVYLELLL